MTAAKTDDEIRRTLAHGAAATEEEKAAETVTDATGPAHSPKAEAEAARTMEAAEAIGITAMKTASAIATAARRTGVIRTVIPGRIEVTAHSRRSGHRSGLR